MCDRQSRSIVSFDRRNYTLNATLAIIRLRQTMIGMLNWTSIKVGNDYDDGIINITTQLTLTTRLD